MAFTDGSMAIAGPYVARVITRVLPNRPIPQAVTVSTPDNGEIARSLTDLVMNPPKVPFACFVFGKKAGFRGHVTVDPGFIRINGPEPFDVPAPLMRHWLCLFQNFRESSVVRLLALRARLARGETEEADMVSFAELRELYPEIISSFRKLPSPGTQQALILQRLLRLRQN